jgi:predicted amidohydrolase YtcJ
MSMDMKSIHRNYRALLCNFLACLLSMLVMLQAKASPITIFIAKKIYTMNPSWPEATAVAVKDGRILSVGTLDNLKPWLKTGKYTINRQFEDKILLPGFIEPHTHIQLGGTMLSAPLISYLPVANPYGPDFPGVKSWDALVKQMKQYVSQAKSSDETVYAWGYDSVALKGKYPTKQELDTISKTQPIVISDCSEHFAFANTAAMKKYRITKKDTKIVGLNADANGEPNGQFMGVAAATRILRDKFTQLFQPKSSMKSMKYLIDLSHKNGMTTTSELNMGTFNLELEKSMLNKMFNNPKSPMRVVVVTNADAAVAKYGDKAVDKIKAQVQQSTDKLMFRGVKWFADDAFLSLGMVMVNPGYTDGHQGVWNTPPNKMVEQMLPWWKGNVQINVHSNGNGGNLATLAALEELMRQYPRADHRFTFQHFGMASNDIIRRIARQGGIISVNPYYVYTRSEFNAPFVGEDRAFTAAKFRSIVDAKIPLSMHTDTPVASPNPLEEVWIAVNRFGLSGKVRGPKERVSVHEALRMITIDAAFTLGVENMVGSIEPGKFADFAVLEQDPYKVNKNKIRDIIVWGTVLGGTVQPVLEIKPEAKK